MAGHDPRVHRQLQHLNTGEVRCVARCGDARPVRGEHAEALAEVAAAAASGGGAWPSLFSSGNVSHQTSPGGLSPTLLRRGTTPDAAHRPPATARDASTGEEESATRAARRGTAAASTERTELSNAGSGKDGGFPWWPPTMWTLIATAIAFFSVAMIARRGRRTPQRWTA